jgi:hypothetical protein
MRLQAEVLAKVLREKGLDDATISEILATAQMTAKTSQSSRRSRAKLVRSEKVDEATMEKFRQELMLREWERRVRSHPAIFGVDSVQVSNNQSVVVFRQGDTIVEVTLRHGSGRSAPFNRRFIAQKLPNIRVERLEILRMVVSTAEKTKVLVVGGSQRGVVLPESERRWLMTALDETVTVRCGRWQTKLPKIEWQQILRSWRCKYPVIERQWEKLEVSADGERWFRVSQLIVDRTH